MEPNYRIVKIGKKYYPQVKFRHVVTVGKNPTIHPIHDWVYFKDTRGDDLWVKTLDEARQACIENDKTEVFSEIVELEIRHGKVIEEQKTF